MSVQLPTVNLTAAVVGTQGKVSFGNVLPPATLSQQMRIQAAAGGSMLLVWNISGCGLSCRFPVTGKTFTIPNGGWRQLAVPPGEAEVDYTVSYVLPGASIALLFADLYLPGEAVDAYSVLGTTPIGQSRVISIPTMPHNSAPFTGVALTTAQLPGSLSSGSLAVGPNVPVTVYVYSIALLMTGLRRGLLGIYISTFNSVPAVLSNTLCYLLPLVAGQVNTPLPQPVAVGPFTTPATTAALGISIAWYSGTTYPNSGTSLMAGSILFDVDLTGQTPPPAIGNGAATPVGANY